MSNRRQRRSSSSKSSFSSKKKRSGFRTLVETVMGVSAALLILVLAYWWYFVREKPQISAQPNETTALVLKDNVIDRVEVYESIRDSGDLEELNELLSDLDNWKRDAETPVRLDTLSRRLEIAEKILEHPNIEESLRSSTAMKLLSAMGQFYGISFEEGIVDDGSTVSRYLNICTTFLNDPDKAVAKEAYLSKAKVLVFELTREGKENAAASIDQTIVDLIARYPDDGEIIASIRQLVARVSSQDVRAGASLNRKVIEQYENSGASNPLVINRLRDIKDVVFLEDSGIGKLALEAKNSGSYDQYVERLSQLIENPDTGIGFVNRIYDAVRYFEIVGEHDLAIDLLNHLLESAPARNNEAAKDQADRIARFGLIRNKLVGKKFDFRDTQSDGNPVDVTLIENRPVIIVFYSPNSPDTTAMFNNLNFAYKLMFSTNVRVITVAVEESRTGSLEFGFDPSWISISSSVTNTADIFKQCPVSHVPYFVVVDKQGIVNSINVPLARLKTEVEGLDFAPVSTGN